MPPENLFKVAVYCVAAAVVTANLLVAGGAFGSMLGGDKESSVAPSASGPQLSLVHQKGRRQADHNQGYYGWSHDVRAIEKWSLRNVPDFYAGMYFKSMRKGTRLVVGYSEKQIARVREVKRLPGLIAPMRVAPFPYVPEHSLRELEDLQWRIVNEVMLGPRSGLIVGVGVDVEANRVDVGTRRVRATKKAFGNLFGAEAPIYVHYERAPVPVAGGG